jgi:hypothetical protein
MTATKRPIEWVSVRRAADLLGCAPQTVIRMVKDGELVESGMETEAGLDRTLICLASVHRCLSERKTLAA